MPPPAPAETTRRGLRALPWLACGLLLVGCDNPQRDAGTIDVSAAKAKATADEPTEPTRGGRTPKTQSAATGRTSAPDR